MIDKPISQYTEEDREESSFRSAQRLAESYSDRKIRLRVEIVSSWEPVKDSRGVNVDTELKFGPSHYVIGQFPKFEGRDDCWTDGVVHVASNKAKAEAFMNRLIAEISVFHT